MQVRCEDFALICLPADAPAVGSHRALIEAVTSDQAMQLFLQVAGRLFAHLC